MAGAAFASFGGAQAAEHSHLDALVAKYAAIDGYEVELQAHERRDGGAFDDRRLRFTLRKPDHAKIVVLDGPAAGSRVIWTGGTKVIVHARPVTFLSLSFDLNDKRLLSPRGNTLLSADLGRILACYTARRSDVKEEVNAGTHEVTLHLHRASGVGCDGDPPADKEVTDDVLVLGSDGLPISRERSVGDQLVERWKLENLKVDNAIPDSEFK